VLEFFDRTGVTARVGDARQVRVERLGMFGPSPAAADAIPPSEDDGG
jgi:hypothetical protein